MTKSEFLRRFENILEIRPEPGSLTGAEKCQDIEGWDSLAVLNYIALLHSEFGIKVAPKQVFQCQKVDDLVALAGENVGP